MRRAIVIVPLVGIAAAVAVPLARYAEKQRAEQTVVEVLRQVRAAQEAVHRRAGGYAADIRTLVQGCGPETRLDEAVLASLQQSGYDLAMRAASGAGRVDAPDCREASLVSDYYVAAAPNDAAEAGQQAFAARATGEVYVFYDGVAPNETHMANGLATPLSRRGTFRIP